eukprot:231120_1
MIPANTPFTYESTKSRVLRAAFTGNDDELLQIFQELHQQKLSGNTIETEIMEYIRYSMDHVNPTISAIASKFLTKYCLVKIKSVRKDFPEAVQNRFEITQNLNDVVQFILSQKLMQNVAMLKVENMCVLPDKFDMLFAELEEESNYNTNTNVDTIDLSITVFDSEYMKWDKNNIFANLLHRYNLGIISSLKEQSYFQTNTIYNPTFRRKCEALAQRTILENFELREMVNELRDENFHLGNEIYELADKLKRQILCINELANNNGVKDCKPAIGKLSDRILMKMIEQKVSEDTILNTKDYNIIHHSIAHDDELVNHLIMKYELCDNDGSDQRVELLTDNEENYGYQIKALRLGQRVIRENYELREMVKDRRYRNFLLRQSIYTQQDQINRFVLLINKLERYSEDMNINCKIYCNKGEYEYRLEFEANDEKNGIDWGKWHRISNKLVNGYVRLCVENEYNMIVPHGINPVIANYAIYIFCVLLM